MFYGGDGLYCRNCGAQLGETDERCAKCSFVKGYGTEYCGICGEKIAQGQTLCNKCGNPVKSDDGGKKSLRDYSAYKDEPFVGDHKRFVLASYTYLGVRSNIQM